MTKALPKAARRRLQRQRRISLPGADPVPQRPGQGARRDLEPQEDPMTTVVVARTRRIPPGADPRSPMAGCAVGRRILREPTETHADLWGAVCHMRRVYVAYGRAIGAPSRYAKCLAILTPPDRMEATAESPPLDTRDDATRLRNAVSEWMRVQGWLGYAPKPAQSACIAAVVDDAEVTDWALVLIALSCVAKGMRA